MKNERIYKMSFSKVYPLLLKKVEKKGKTKEELDMIISWLTGYDEKQLQQQLDLNVSYEIFFKEAPQLNKNAYKITGLICGYRIEEIEEPLMKQIRWLDKLVDELYKGKSMDKILRGE